MYKTKINPEVASIILFTSGTTAMSKEDTLKALQKEIDKFEKQGINKIILLSHAGFHDEQEIAKNTEGIDIIIGGHSHNLLKGVTENQNLFSKKVFTKRRFCSKIEWKEFDNIEEKSYESTEISSHFVKALGRGDQGLEKRGDLELSLYRNGCGADQALR